MEWNELPAFIKNIMLEEQERQTGKWNESVFIDNVAAEIEDGGIDWEDCKEGYCINRAIMYDEIHLPDHFQTPIYEHSLAAEWIKDNTYNEDISDLNGHCWYVSDGVKIGDKRKTVFKEPQEGYAFLSYDEFMWYLVNGNKTVMPKEQNKAYTATINVKDNDIVYVHEKDAKWRIGEANFINNLNDTDFNFIYHVLVKVKTNPNNDNKLSIFERDLIESILKRLDK